MLIVSSGKTATRPAVSAVQDLCNLYQVEMLLGEKPCLLWSKHNTDWRHMIQEPPGDKLEVK